MAALALAARMLTLSVRGGADAFVASPQLLSVAAEAFGRRVVEMKRSSPRSVVGMVSGAVGASSASVSKEAGGGSLGERLRADFPILDQVRLYAGAPDAVFSGLRCKWCDLTFARRVLGVSMPWMSFSPRRDHVVLQEAAGFVGMRRAHGCDGVWSTRALPSIPSADSLRYGMVGMWTCGSCVLDRSHVRSDRLLV